MTTSHPAETRFIELMAELFQLDEAEALDFGLYRVIRRHNAEVRAFLGEIKADKHGKALVGGRLSALMDEAFTQAGEETKASDRWRIEELAKSLGIMPGMTADNKNQRLAAAETFEDTAQKVKEYRRISEQLSAATTASHDRAEVLNRLYQFFSRHYQDGDFIVERRYGKNGARYIRSTGEDSEFHWATEDMYYIKTGDIFTDFPVRLSNGQKLVFTVEPETLQATRALLKPNDKAHYELDAILPSPEVGRNKPAPAGVSGKPTGQMPETVAARPYSGLHLNTFIVRLKYHKGAQSDKHKEAIVEAVIAKVGGDPVEIKRRLNRYIARNQSDFFIHKRLKAALAEDLDIFLKTEVLDADQLMGDGDLPKRSIKVARLVKMLGFAIIDFLAALEDFQKALWEKKKLVFDTRYVITLDRIERLAGVEWLDRQIALIVGKQREEWQALSLGDYPNPSATQRTGQPDLLYDGPRYLPLPVDTGRFDEVFKWDLLEAVTRQTGLDDALDGVAIHSDNWQALNTIQAKYKERVKCIYIDPPYNTGGDGFPYKDAYPHASWLAMMKDRLDFAASLLTRNGALFASIDHVERNALTEVLSQALGRQNRVEEIIWGQNTTKNQSPTYSTNHEYVEVFARDLSAASGDERMFREPKPGAAEILELVEKLNPDYPSIAEIERQIKSLFEKHRLEFRTELEESGIEYDKTLDNWKGLYNYQNAEYRDNYGRYVTENLAKIKHANIWIWKEGDSSFPKGGGTDNKIGVHTLGDPDYRFYRPRHPNSGLPCPHPKTGWRWPEMPAGLSSSFSELDFDNRIVWGEWNPKKPKVPQVKRFLQELDTQVSKSIILDYTDGEKELTNLTGKSRSFPNPKPTSLIERFILQTTDADEWVMDFFAGSGTTFHAATSARHDDRQRRRVLLVEGGNHFEPILLARIKRICAAWAWKNGKPLAINGPGLFLRVQTLEQYEDTLENLAFEAEGGQTEISFDDPAFQLRYRLDKTSRKLFTGVERFGSPFGYQLKRVEGGDAPARTVDLVESLVYLLGLDVNRLYREPAGVVLTGSNRRGQSAAVFFRDVEQDDSTQWLQTKLAEYPADHVYTNDAAALSFQGCERFEAIEAVFALQFWRV
ncbi:MAG: site-specific DNA-methyltransferase [Candidatus Methylumidiphilus sp.]